MVPTPEKFAVEREVYAAHKREWIDAGAQGKWVAIRGPEVIGPLDVFASVWRAAVDRLGKPGEFMVRQIVRDERPFVVSHVR